MIGVTTLDCRSQNNSNIRSFLVMSEINPWLSLSKEDNRVIASCDKPVLDKLSFSNLTKLCLELHPEPFVGDPDAAVYLLTGNPGFSDQDNCFFCLDTLPTILTDVYSHKNKDFFWIDPKYKIEAECPRSKRTIVHPGQEYWQKRLRELTRVLGRTPRLFELEYYPYHSKDFYSFMMEPLPSFEYTKQLVKKAIKEKKTIFILRHKKEWLAAIPELKNNYHTLTSPRNTYMTSGNMSKEAWSDLINKS